ncbi:uncharacterized protein JCM15063_003747 [Sporobolomyces koalae]|uniref:uncharacterized protein n=1 Tax=Sporobolomyces koalae TaxID=500713 RepID=UPI00316C264B
MGMDVDSSRAATLTSLPPEILIRIVRFFLDPRSIVRLGRTCTTLHELARSDLVWKEIVLDLVGTHGVHSEPDDDDDLDYHDDLDNSATTWWEQAKFLLPNARHLGYFASSIPFSSRIVRVAVVLPRARERGETHTLSSRPPRYRIHAAQLRPMNQYNVNSPPPRHMLPFGANLEITLDAYHISRHENPHHPDAGISCDVLEPMYDFSASMIDIDTVRGAVLSRPNLETRPAGAVPTLDPDRHRRPRVVRAQLGLALEPVSQLVSNDSRRSPDDESHPTNPELSREALLALFSGRLPRREWPTLELVGLHPWRSRSNGRIQPGHLDEPVRLQVGRSGAFRGLQEWITERGTEARLARIERHYGETLDSQQDDQAFVSGFRLKAKRARTARSNPPASARTGTNRPDVRSSSPAHRRRGIGRNGGMAVLWNGHEEDPDEVPRVTILRAGDQNEGGIVLRLQEERDHPSDASSDDEADPASSSTFPTDNLADAIDATGEAFFPIKPPAKPISWEEAASFNRSDETEISARSLEGMWLGSYGSHGLEFVHLSVSLSNPTSSPPSRPPTPDPDSSTCCDREQSGFAPIRILTATKITGDTNVPSGETTWIAFLDEVQARPLESTRLHHHRRNDDMGSSEDCLFDLPISTISQEKWDSINRQDPNRTPRVRMTDWNEGTTEGVGQIALSGFLQPGWTSASVRFIRSRFVVRKHRETGRVVVTKDQTVPTPATTFERDDDVLLDSRDRGGAEEEKGGEEDWETTSYESVEEIQLRWAEMNKIAIFKRVRI